MYVNLLNNYIRFPIGDINIGKGQYWQIAYQKFLVRQDCIKEGSRNINI